MNKKQYEAMRKKLMDEAQALINAGKADDAQEKMNEVKALDERWDGIAQAVANFNALNTEPAFSSPIDMRGEMEADGRLEKSVLELWDSELYKNAWAHTLMGKELVAEEVEAFAKVNEAYTHTTKNTGVVIPKSVINKIWELAGEKYPYFEDVTKTYINGIFSVPQEDTSSDASWYEEDIKTEDGKETFNEFILSGCELSRVITVSWKLKEMAMEDFIPYIERKMAKKMGAGAGYGAVHGAGPNATGGKPEPTGVITALEAEENTPQIVTYKKGERPTYQNITEARAKIKSGYGGIELKVYANNSTIWNKIANVLDTNKRPIFVADPLTGGFRVLGMIVEEDDSLRDGEILFSNAAAGYHMNINKEMTMMPEEHVKDRRTDY